jgi:hypothetical protein
MIDRSAIFFENGDFAAPHYVDDVEDVPSDFRHWYVPRGPGKVGYRLTERIWKDLRRPFEKQLDALDEQQRQLAAAHEAAIAKRQSMADSIIVDRALSDAFKAHNAVYQLIPAAAALLKEANEVSVDWSDAETPRVMVKTPLGTLAASDAVSRFLVSSQGTPFRGKEVEQTDGHFADLMQQLSGRAAAL